MRVRDGQFLDEVYVHGSRAERCGLYQDTGTLEWLAVCLKCRTVYGNLITVSNQLAAARCCQGRQEMSKADEIKAAEKKELEALRAHHLAGEDSWMKDWYSTRDKVRAAQAKLAALQSPLPTHAEMAARWRREWDNAPSTTAEVERHWADALRWLANWNNRTKSNASSNAPIYSGDLFDFADELERRSK